GFGFSIMSTPFFILIFSPHDAIILNIILSIVMTLIMTYKVRNEINKELLKRLIKGSLLGLLPGLGIFTLLNVEVLKIFVGILILVSTILLMKKIDIKQSNVKEYITGALSGFLTSSIGLCGPPLMIYFSGARIEKAILRSTTMAYFLFIYSMSLFLQLSVYKISQTIVVASLWSIPFILFGISLGDRFFKKLDQELLYRIIYWLLLLTGVYLLISTLKSFA
ncbi:MAG: sulfite exporter TauE/SafE family protein, partial [Peptococcales bacterium]